jgi:hypothetical protein
MKFAEHYNRYLSDKESLTYYKLRYTSQLGNSELERSAMNYYENEQVKKNGILNGIINKGEPMNKVNIF